MRKFNMNKQLLEDIQNKRGMFSDAMTEGKDMFIGGQRPEVMPESYAVSEQDTQRANQVIEEHFAMERARGRPARRHTIAQLTDPTYVAKTMRAELFQALKTEVLDKR